MDPELQKIFAKAFQDELEKCGGLIGMMLPWVALEAGLKGIGALTRGAQRFGKTLGGGVGSFSPHKLTA